MPDSIDVRVPAAELPDGIYVIHLGDGSGPVLTTADPPAWGGPHEPVRLTRGELLAWRASHGGTVTVERVS